MRMLPQNSLHTPPRPCYATDAFFIGAVGNQGCEGDMTTEASEIHSTDAERDSGAQAGQAARAEAGQEAGAEAPPEVGAEAKQAGEPTEAASRIDQARAIIRRNVLWALAAGLVPVPLIDFLALEAVEVKMLNELSQLYKLDFREDFAKKVIGSLLSTVGSVGVGAALGFALVKFVPVVGTALSLVTMPLLAAASTRALGNAFLMHFESGGTVLNFDPDKMRSYFMKEFEKSKKVVAEMRQEQLAQRP
jgi:uncharacterized protein (DUF697 family)